MPQDLVCDGDQGVVDFILDLFGECTLSSEHSVAGFQQNKTNRKKKKKEHQRTLLSRVFPQGGAWRHKAHGDIRASLIIRFRKWLFYNGRVWVFFLLPQLDQCLCTTTWSGACRTGLSGATGIRWGTAELLRSRGSKGGSRCTASYANCLWHGPGKLCLVPTKMLHVSSVSQRQIIRLIACMRHTDEKQG